MAGTLKVESHGWRGAAAESKPTQAACGKENLRICLAVDNLSSDSSEPYCMLQYKQRRPLFPLIRAPLAYIRRRLFLLH